jgi:hypothetical protein
MDFVRAFTFITQDERWPAKVGIGSLVMLAGMFLIFPAIFLMGYQVALMRNVIKGAERPLPEWEEWGKLFSDGLQLFVALLIYTLPLWLFYCAGLTIVFLPLLPALGGGSEEMFAVLMGLVFATWGFLLCLVFVFMLLLLLITPAIYVQYVRTNELAALFRFRELYALIRAHLAEILLVAAAGLLANMSLGVITTPLIFTGCGLILVVPGLVWVMLALAHMYGQIARQAEGKSAASV